MRKVIAALHHYEPRSTHAVRQHHSNNTKQAPGGGLIVIKWFSNLDHTNPVIFVPKKAGKLACKCKQIIWMPTSAI